MPQFRSQIAGREVTIDLPEDGSYPKHPIAWQSEVVLLRRVLEEIGSNETLSNEDRMRLALDALRDF